MSEQRGIMGREEMLGDTWEVMRVLKVGLMQLN